MRWWTLVAVVVPPVALAAIGLTHPARLTADSAQCWTTMHIILLPIFPLLGVAIWVLVRGVPLSGVTGVLAAGARVAAFGYITCYGALDALAGIGGGTLVRDGADPGPLFGIGNDLGTVGTWAFLVASGLTAAVAYRRHGRWTLPGAVVLVAASVSFLDSHVYFPRGVLTMLALAVGFGLLAAAPPRLRVPNPGDVRGRNIARRDAHDR